MFLLIFLIKQVFILNIYASSISRRNQTIPEQLLNNIEL
jgi:hypothetical protein